MRRGIRCLPSGSNVNRREEGASMSGPLRKLLRERFQPTSGPCGHEQPFARHAYFA
jgi:hypothetical protein